MLLSPFIGAKACDICVYRKIVILTSATCKETGASTAHVYLVADQNRYPPIENGRRDSFAVMAMVRSTVQLASVTDIALPNRVRRKSK